MKKEIDIFEKLKVNAEHLSSNPSLDNEAMRHDSLVYPFMESALGWASTDLCSQRSIAVPQQIADSHIFRASIPKRRTPDIVVTSADVPITLLVLEEKKRQNSIAALNEHRIQLHEYQSLFESVWGVLTDGEKWILKRNFENFHVFDGLDELRKGLKDIQNAIGKQNMLERYRETGKVDLLNVIYMPPALISIPNNSAVGQNSFQNEIIIESLKFQEKYPELFETSPLSIDELINIVGKDYFENGINVSVVDTEAEHIRALNVESGKKVEILVSGNMNQCWKRYSVVKQLCQLILSKNEYISPKLQSTSVEQAIFALTSGKSMDAAIARYEYSAEVLAMSLLIPTSKWSELDDWMNSHEASTYELAHWFRIPQEKLNAYLQSIHSDAKTLFQLIKYLGRD